jgi:hypothetical protein
MVGILVDPLLSISYYLKELFVYLFFLLSFMCLLLEFIYLRFFLTIFILSHRCIKERIHKTTIYFVVYILESHCNFNANDALKITE